LSNVTSAGTNTLAGRFILVNSGCSTNSFLRFTPRNDPECDGLFRSSLLNAAAAALKAVVMTQIPLPISDFKHVLDQPFKRASKCPEI
jgi:hypothetical protein